MLLLESWLRNIAANFSTIQRLQQCYQEIGIRRGQRLVTTLRQDRQIVYVYRHDCFHVSPTTKTSGSIVIGGRDVFSLSNIGAAVHDSGTDVFAQTSHVFVLGGSDVPSASWEISRCLRLGNRYGGGTVMVWTVINMDFRGELIVILVHSIVAGVCCLTTLQSTQMSSAAFDCPAQSHTVRIIEDYI